MTIAQQFRSNADLTAKMRELLNEPAMALALTILKAGGMPTEDPIGGNELQSVRLLNQSVGWNSCIQNLTEMAEPYVPRADAGAETWGTDPKE